MTTALISHRGVGKIALLKHLEILFFWREDAILSDLDFEIENSTGWSIASISTIEASTAVAKGPSAKVYVSSAAKRASNSLTIHGGGKRRTVTNPAHRRWLRGVRS